MILNCFVFFTNNKGGAVNLAVGDSRLTLFALWDGKNNLSLLLLVTREQGRSYVTYQQHSILSRDEQLSFEHRIFSLSYAALLYNFSNIGKSFQQYFIYHSRILSTITSVNGHMYGKGETTSFINVLENLLYNYL